MPCFRLKAAARAPHCRPEHPGIRCPLRALMRGANRIPVHCRSIDTKAGNEDAPLQAGEGAGSGRRRPFVRLHGITRSQKVYSKQRLV